MTTFTPLPSDIINITNACPAVVTTGSSHGFYTGMVVRLLVPQAYGMTQLNHAQVSITVIDSTSFSCQYYQTPPAVNVDSTNFYPFVLATGQRFPAEVLPIGAGPTPATETEWEIKNNLCESKLEDTFTNVSN